MIPKHTTNTGDCFEVGQVWISPRGIHWRVDRIDLFQGNPRKQATLRLSAGLGYLGSKKVRDWDAVKGWVIHRHKDGTLAGPA